jgi:pyruvate formate lyase activating enzyme
MGERDATVNVSQIERFATHDGPGIRTTVFLKGCPLHCPWCANPETQPTSPVMFHDERKCVGCGACAAACPARAISLDDGFAWDRRACVRTPDATSCTLCERACMHEAISFSGELMSVGDVMDVVLRDRDYYENSCGGGMTISGGEPLANRGQALALLEAAKVEGLNTAVETTGNVARSTVEAVEPLVDHFLHDLKHLDDVRLREVTGGDGLSVAPERVNVRIPVIPGFNHDDATIRSMLDWLAERGCTKVNLLPYHTLGRSKCTRMGKAYEWDEHPLDEADLAAYHAYALELGMESKVGA